MGREVDECAERWCCRRRRWESGEMMGECGRGERVCPVRSNTR